MLTGSSGPAKPLFKEVRSEYMAVPPEVGSQAMEFAQEVVVSASCEAQAAAGRHANPGDSTVPGPTWRAFRWGPGRKRENHRGEA